MNSASIPSASTIWAQLLPKMAAVFFLLYWVMPGMPISLDRLGFVFGTLALIEAVTVAAARKAQPVLDWGDLGGIGRCLVAPGNLPVYALLLGGTMLFADTAPPGWQRGAIGNTERVTVPSRVAPSARPTTPVINSNSGISGRPTGSPGSPAVNFPPRPRTSPPAASTPPGSSTRPAPKFGANSLPLRPNPPAPPTTSAPAQTSASPPAPPAGGTQTTAAPK